MSNEEKTPETKQFMGTVTFDCAVNQQKMILVVEGDEKNISIKMEYIPAIKSQDQELILSPVVELYNKLLIKMGGDSNATTADQ